MFAEVDLDSAGARKFNVDMEGKQVIGDVYAMVGKEKAYDVS
jgi:hypothetical protein